MRFIAPLLALLSLCVDALPTNTNTTEVAIGNSTNSMWINEDPLCFWGGSTQRPVLPGECRKPMTRFHDRDDMKTDTPHGLLVYTLLHEPRRTTRLDDSSYRQGVYGVDWHHAWRSGLRLRLRGGPRAW